MPRLSGRKFNILDFVAALPGEVAATGGIWHLCSVNPPRVMVQQAKGWRGLQAASLLCDLARIPQLNGVWFEAELNRSSRRQPQIAVGSAVSQLQSGTSLWAPAWDWCVSGFWTIAQCKTELSNGSSLQAVWNILRTGTIGSNYLFCHVFWIFSSVNNYSPLFSPLAK